MSSRRAPFKVLLVSPPIRRIRFNISGVYPMQPLGIASLAAYLRERGVKIAIIDAVAMNWSVERTAEEIFAQAPSLVGFSTTIFNLADTHFIAKKLKAGDPKIFTLLGGYGVVFPPEQLGSRLKEFDFFIRGEGEAALYKLVQTLEVGGSLTEIPGLIYREGDSARFTPPAEPLDINTLPLPALDLLPKADYRMHPPFNIKPPLCLVETARGCGWRCNFCSLSRRLRQKNVSRVIEEIGWAKSIFKANEIHFVDPTFTATPGRLKELTKAIKSEFPGLAWTCKSRVELIDEEIAAAMAESGCYMVSLGVESGSQPMLDALNKESLVEETRRAIKALKKYKIKTLAYMMFGSPGETDETVAETMSLIKELRPDYPLFAGLMPDPLSALLKARIQEGGFSEEDVFDLYYNGRSQNTAFENNSFTGVNQAKLERWVKHAYIDYYLSPRYFAERLAGVRNFREIANLVTGAGMLFRDGLSLREILKSDGK